MIIDSIPLRFDCYKTHVGLVWAPNSQTLYAAGGCDDAVYAYTKRLWCNVLRRDAVLMARGVFSFHAASTAAQI
jgi:hypothetical protein